MYPDQVQLDSLKAAIRKQTEMDFNDALDCELLAVLIHAKTGLTITVVPLCRLFGLAPSRFPPSLYTLNTLAAYCGFVDWKHLVKNDQAGISDSEIS